MIIGLVSPDRAVAITALKLQSLQYERRRLL